MRRTLFAVVVAASWAVLLAWAADVEWHAPFVPRTTQLLPGAQFHPVFGTAERLGDRLHVENTAADRTALQSTTLGNVDAAAFQVLRYRFAGFPRTLEIALVFRSSDQPDDVRSISLPWPGEGTATFDLSRDPAWHGTISEIGFAEYATPQLVPADRGFAPFDVVKVELWSPSWLGAIETLRTDWFGVWPWSLRSVHVLGRENGTPDAHSIVVAAAIAAALWIGWAIVLLRWRGVRAWRGLAWWVIAAWLALDMTWQHGLWARLLATRAVYANVAGWPARERIVGDTGILDAADQVKAIVARMPHQPRILVDAGGKYSMLRMIWHLLPLNASDFGSALAEQSLWSDGLLIVFYDSDTWRTQPWLRQLLIASERVSLHPDAIHSNGFDIDPLTIFRYHRAH